MDRTEGRWHWSPERHLLALLKERNVDKVTQAHVDDIVGTCMSSCGFLSAFTGEFQSNYRFLIEESLGVHVGERNEDVVQAVTPAVPSWDTYSLCVSLLSVVGYGFTQSQYCNRPMISFAEILVSGVHPDPGRRPRAGDNFDALRALFSSV